MCVFLNTDPRFHEEKNKMIESTFASSRRSLHFTKTAMCLFTLLAISVNVSSADEPPAAAPQDVPPRCGILEGQSNFRDLGGYETEDGRAIKWGVLFRSGGLYSLTDKDVETLEEIGLRSVVTFLDEDETASKGEDRLPEGVNEIAAPFRGVVDEDLSEAVSTAKASGDFSAVPADYRLQLHRALIENGADSYAAVVRQIIREDEGAPLAFHCSQGVHRAGTATAVLLALLGVPQETIREDFLLSNSTRETEIAAKLDQLRSYASDSLEPSEAMASIESMEAYHVLDPAYIDASLDAIVEEYGSIENYARKRLGLTCGEITKFRDTVLE
jgi:protein-tyrosine phosphatase